LLRQIVTECSVYVPFSGFGFGCQEQHQNLREHRILPELRYITDFGSDYGKFDRNQIPEHATKVYTQY
jgi:hypothetical protein